MEFNATFLISAISFILFTIIMNKIFYKPLENIMNEREKFINENLVDAKLSSNKADEITKAREAKLAKSQIDAKTLIAKKVNDANKNSGMITDNAKMKSKENIKSAKEALINEVKNTEKELEFKIEDLAEIISSKILEQS